MSTPHIETVDTLPLVGQCTFINRQTLCPVCLQPCDLTAQDIVPYWPAYLEPYDTLRAYDGCYHRACLYRVGDYQRMIEAWHRMEQARSGIPAADGTRTMALERDLMVRTLPHHAGIELVLFPRFARWEFTDAATFTLFLRVLEAYLAAPDRRKFGITQGAMEIRPVENHELCSVRWAIPLQVTASWDAAVGLPKKWMPRGFPWLRRSRGPHVQLTDAPPPRSVSYRGGQLEPGIAWDLHNVDGYLASQTSDAQSTSIELLTARLRFVPIWDDEAMEVVRFLHQHEIALRQALPAGVKRN